MRVNSITAKQQEYRGKVYYLCGNYFQRKGERLHRTVWEKTNGRKIPNGYHVHHIDGDRSNNAPENLALVRGSEHISLHGKGRKATEKQLKHLERIRPLTVEWHRSAEGREWHRQQSKQQWQKREPETYTCTHCGEEFQSLNRYGGHENRFCSNNCKSAYRRAQGYDDVIRACERCGKERIVNKYSKSRFCSRWCAHRKEH